MHNSSLDFLRLAHVPEVFTQIAAGTTDNRQLAMILIMAGRAFPFVVIVNGDFAIKAADMAIVGLRVELSILDIIINEFNNLFQGLQIMTHIRNLYIGNSAAGGNVLELAFKFKFAKGINLLAHVNV